MTKRSTKIDEIVEKLTKIDKFSHILLAGSNANSEYICPGEDLDIIVLCEEFTQDAHNQVMNIASELPEYHFELRRAPVKHPDMPQLHICIYTYKEVNEKYLQNWRSCIQKKGDIAEVQPLGETNPRTSSSLQSLLEHAPWAIKKHIRLLREGNIGSGEWEFDERGIGKFVPVVAVGDSYNTEQLRNFALKNSLAYLSTHLTVDDSLKILELFEQIITE